LPSVGGAYATTFVFVLLVYFVLAQSWDWIGGEMGYVNLGHFAFYGIGAYSFCIALVAGAPIWLSLIIAVIATTLIAAIVAVPLFRLHGDYFAFATLALLPLAELLAFNLVPLTKGADGIVLPPHYVLVPAYYLAAGLAAVTFVVTIVLSGSRFGFALKAIRNDEQACETVGVATLWVKVRTLMLTAAFAALAGGIHAWQLSYIDPPTVFGLNVALVPIAMALLGGSGLLWGPLIGVILLAAAQQWLLVNLTMLQGTIYGAAILLIGRFMPGGLLRSLVMRRVPWLAWLGHEHHERVRATPPAAGSVAALALPHRSADRAATLLECRNMTMAFGGNVAVNDVSFKIAQGEIVGLIGANGSGKTTLFNCISRVYEPRSGDILLDGQSLMTRRRDTVAHLGIGRTYQIPRPFNDLTVQENIAIGVLFRADGTSDVREALAEAVQFAAYAGLGHRLDDRADALSLQEKKALELARALAGRPRLLLVDEVASGLTPAEAKKFVAHLREIRDVYGITIIWVEHIFSALAQVVDRVIVLEEGRIIADGPLAEVIREERVLRTYLGSAAVKVA
jgi:branched-chain amino acid transport system permease protein